MDVEFFLVAVLAEVVGLGLLTGAAYLFGYSVKVEKRSTITQKITGIDASDLRKIVRAEIAHSFRSSRR